MAPADPPSGESGFRLVDDLGPAKVVHLHEQRSGLRAIVVVDNVACGTAIGGVRMAADATLEECARLARAMTFKNAAAGLPHGGGKAVILADPHQPAAEKEQLLRAFAGAIRDLRDYVPGPDMGTDERCMAWIADEIGRAVGLPAEQGGIPLDEIGATGFGLAVAVDAARPFADLEIEGARVAVQGFGAVGQHAARFLVEKGAILVAAADSHATLVDPDGLDLARLIRLKEEGGSFRDAGFGERRDARAVLEVPCEIWIPAARPDVIDEHAARHLQARLIVQGANIPATEAAERVLHERGVLGVPDFIANAGGVICASIEYHGGTRTLAFQAIEEKIRANTTAVLEESARKGVPPREAAQALARARLRKAMAHRRWT
jgi:glutamate dehydrogenase (NAD(P)+)